ncbi:MAG: selenium metabolism-associated LysR family transcriptional regulator [Nitrospirota bacterium]|nr:selenium metabolism-associated LysR family transcriptional regulator [Nitrospirota bacterium]
MDIKLKLFCAVAETRSFSKTSRIAHLSQPAVSLQIQALEEFFETKLFDRSGGEINLTPAGEILYHQAKHILEHYTDIEKEMRKITGAIKGGFTFGASTSLGDHVLPRVIIGFKKEHPKVKISMMVGNTKRVEELLKSGFIDFGLVAGECMGGKLKRETIMSDELILIVSRDHPWVKKKVVSILDILREPFILREEGSGTRQKIEEYFAMHGISIHQMHIAMVLGSTASIKEAVEAGVGVSIVSKWAVQREFADGRLKLITFKEGNIQRDLSLILPARKHLSHVMDEFLIYARKYPYDTFFKKT